jgi:pilus assembly protein Flp/PilA
VKNGRAWKFMKRLCGDRRAATAIEYGLILALVFLAIVGAVNSLADETIDMWDDIGNGYESAM